MGFRIQAGASCNWVPLLHIRRGMLERLHGRPRMAREWPIQADSGCLVSRSRAAAGSPASCADAPAFTRREAHLHPTPPASRALGSPRTRMPPRLRGGRLTFTLRPPRPALGSPRTDAPRLRGGRLTFTYAPRPALSRDEPPRLRGGRLTFTLRPPRPRTRKPAHPDAPAFTRREAHLHPTPPRPRTKPRTGCPRVYAAGGSPSPYASSQKRHDLSCRHGTRSAHVETRLPER